MPNLIKRDLFFVSYIMQEAFDECHLFIMWNEFCTEKQVNM